ncbi:hypothetical protein Ahy_A02g009600 [Arachis hypogaea]|uniref:Retrotransposon gag domain-containing protein n=1 Tax=Arachis hypogaea TaxID=3818 RepID=A0A445EHI2_ARAHY|nr:hypothetical protein Ahy_A02g009600 [Arachis hypogaea]
MQIQFGPSQFDNPREDLLKLKQSSTFNAYFDTFTDLVARAYGMDDALLLDCFVGGLHPDLKCEDSTTEEPHHLPFNALLGVPSRKSIRETTSDSHGWRSSDNFIHPDLSTMLALPIFAAPKFVVQISNGALLHCEGEVCIVPVTIQGHTLYISAFVLPIASKELVLGDSWLETLDTHLVNYKDKFITFLARNRLVTLQGKKWQGPTQAHFSQF